MPTFIGNRTGLPTNEVYLEQISKPPAKLRVFHDHDFGGDRWWTVDGYAIVNGQFTYTEEIRCYPTWEEAIAELPELAGVLGVPTGLWDGIERQWVDTEHLDDNGMPRVLTFDECEARGLDGTGRTA